MNDATRRDKAELQGETSEHKHVMLVTTQRTGSSDKNEECDISATPMTNNPIATWIVVMLTVTSYNERVLAPQHAETMHTRRSEGVRDAFKWPGPSQPSGSITLLVAIAASGVHTPTWESKGARIHDNATPTSATAHTMSHTP